MEKLNTQNTLTIAGHPIGLFYLFATEFWERFSYYGMRALLVLYVVDQFFQDSDTPERKAIAYGIFGAYGALVYATPVLGGIIADKFLGYRKAIVLGAVLMALGHFAMAFSGSVMFYGALGLLIVGNGFFKPNVSALVGSLYPDGDARREGGFTIFYMGVNLGAFFSPLVCGWLGMNYGWHYGFGIAGLGMLAGLLIFLLAEQKKVLGTQGFTPENYQNASFLGLKTDNIIYLISFLAVPLFSFLVFKNEYSISEWDLMTIILSLIGIGVLIKIGQHMLNENKQAAERLFVVVLLTFFIMIFWSFFEQAGTSLTIFADENVSLPSWCNAAQTQSINPLVIMLFAIPFAAMWPALATKKLNPNTIVKSFMGLTLLGLGFLVFAYSANFMNEDGKVPFSFLVLGYFVLTIGELCISPVGLSKVTELSPNKIVGFMIGAFYLSSSFAHHLAGMIAKLTIPNKNNMANEARWLSDMAKHITGLDTNALLENTAKFESLATSTTIFAQIGIVAIAMGIVVLILSPVIKKLMNGIH